MHIAHFVHRYPPALGGAEAYFARLSHYLADRGDHVTVWTTTAVDLEAFWRTGRKETSTATTIENCVQVRRYRPWRWPGRRHLLKAASLVPIRAWQCATLPCNPFVPEMFRDAAHYAGPLDAVHATAFPYSLPILCGLRLARRRGVPFLLTPFLHLGDPTDQHDRTKKQYTTASLRWLLRQADLVFVQTEAERRSAIDLGVPEPRVILQGLGVEPAECTGGNRAAARRAWGVASGEVVIGHLANASAEKGTIDLLRAAERAWARNKPFRVVLAGPVMPNFRRFWEEFSPKQRATQLGVLTDSAKRDFFAGLDVFALPSRSDSFGLVLLEAWANSLPNLVYRAGGPAELVWDGEDGLQVRCGDVAELERQLMRLVDDADLRQRLGERGRARIAKEFCWRDKLEIVRDALVCLAASRSPRRRARHATVSRSMFETQTPITEPARS